LAVFNPSPGQPNDPNYLNYSRVTPAPEPNTSTGLALSAAGEGIAGATSILDTSLKKGLQETIDTKVDVERDKFTAGLEQVKSQLDSNTIPPAVRTAAGASTGGLISSTDDQEQENPVGLDSGLSRVQQLAQAKAAGSIKINDTQYAAQTLAIAKQLRTQYPGYRDYIDETVSKASGLPVANSYYQNLMIDINRQLTQMGKSKDDIGNLMQKNLDVPQMGNYLVQRANQDPKYPGDAAMVTKISDWQNIQTQQKIDAAKRAESKDNTDVQKQNEEKNFTRTANDIVAHHMQDMMQLSGMPKLSDLTNYFNDVAAGRRTAPDAEVQQRAQQLQVYRNYISSQLDAAGHGPDEVLGAKKAQEIRDAALSPIDTFIKFANDKETGPAYFHAHQNAAIKEDETNNWLISKDRGALSRQLLTARGILGEQYFPDFLRSIIVNGQDKPFADLFSQEALSAVAPFQDARQQNLTQPRTIVDAVQHGKQVGVNDPDFYGKTIELVGKIADPNMPATAKDRMINWAFNKPELMDELRIDYRDPNTNQMVPGKYRAFNLMTSPAIVQSVAETAKVHPENYQKLQNFSEVEFAKLFRSDLGTLTTLTKGPLPIMPGGTRSIQMHYGYDDVSKQIIPVDEGNKPIDKNAILQRVQYDKASFTHWQSIFDTIDRVNGGINSLKNVQLHNPQGEQNTDKYLLQTLQTAGRGFAPDSIYKAIAKTRNPEMTSEQLDKLLLTPEPQ